MKNINSIYTVLSIILISEYHLYFVSSCLFKTTKRKKTGIWDVQDHPRKFYYDDGGSGCNCGIYKNMTSQTSDLKTFVVYVHSQTNVKDKNDTTICTGTIIASNLVATSHRCIQLLDRNIQVYDTWRHPPKFPSGENLIHANMVTISTSSNTSIGNVYKVKYIILNTRYAISTVPRKNATILDDLALLVTNDNLFKHGHNSICIPNSAVAIAKDSEALGPIDVVNQFGLFYDVTSDLSYSPTIEVKSELQKLVIMRGRDCDKEGGFLEIAADDSLCVRYIGNSLPVKSTGGPLLVTSTAPEGDKASFLVGIGSEVNIRSSTSFYRYIYFSNIISLVKYIEMYAHKMGSEWCKSKDFRLGPKVHPTPVNLYPWKALRKPVNRDESLDCACGIRNNQKNAKNAEKSGGGIEAEPYEFPWIVKLDLFFNNNYSDIWNCGGAVINDRLIITAAHCVFNSDDDENIISDVRVRINVHKIESADPNEKFWDVSNIYYHPDFLASDENAIFPDGDIALVSLKTPIKFSTLRKPGGSSDLRPICVHSESNFRIPTSREIATVAGWGYTDSKNQSSLSDELRKLDVPIMSLERCKSLDARITDKMLCAGYVDDSKDHKKGDPVASLGSPLMLPDKNHYAKWGGQLYEIGIVSFGSNVYENGQKNVLGAYANVQKYLDFIDYHSEKEGAKWCQPPY